MLHGLTTGVARLLAGSLCGRGCDARLLIFAYHRVLAAPDPMLPGEVLGDYFAQQMRTVQRTLRVLPLREAVDRLLAGTLPARAACITFDDGYATNFNVAAPILQRLGLPATFFIASGFLDGSRMWNDTVIEAVRRWRADAIEIESVPTPRLSTRTMAEKCAAADTLLTALRRLPDAERTRRVDELERAARLDGDSAPTMMGGAQLRELARAGMDIGGHTISHPILTSVTDDSAWREIADNRAQLEALLDRPIVSFAYPNGKPGLDFTATHVAMVRRAGYQVAVTTCFGSADGRADIYQLPRVMPWNQPTHSFLRRLLFAYRQA